MHKYSVSLDMSNTCTMGCKFCYRRNINKTTKDNLSIDNIKILIDILSKDPNFKKHIMFMGAEPTENMEGIKYFIDNCPDWSFSISSNGDYLKDPSSYEYLKKCRLFVSIDPTEKLFRANRNAKDLIKFITDIHNATPNAMFRSSFDKRFFDEYEEAKKTFEYIESLGAEWQINPTTGYLYDFSPDETFLKALSILKHDMPAAYEDVLCADGVGGELRHCRLDGSISIDMNLNLNPCVSIGAKYPSNINIKDVESISAIIDYWGEHLLEPKLEKKLPICKGCPLEFKKCRMTCPLYQWDENGDNEDLLNACKLDLLIYYIKIGEIKL